MGQAGGNLKAGGGGPEMGAGGEGGAAGRDSDRGFGDFKGLQGRFPPSVFRRERWALIYSYVYCFLDAEWVQSFAAPNQSGPPTWTRRVAERLGVFPATRD